MTAASYTANYQMMYLFFESARGELINNTVRESLQGYLYDVNKAVKEEHEESLEAIYESTIEYFEPLINDQEDADSQLGYIRNYLKDLDLETEETDKYFKKIFAELLESL